ncbi:MAG: hypothetical protein N2A99_06260 [Carnobacterium alterfunditum]
MEYFYVIDNFNIFTQLVVPGISGLLGGIALVIMATMKDGFTKFLGFYWKFGFLGVLAGIAAVNLLNPDGDISQVMVLGLIAGLSGVSYLKRTALVDNIHEEIIFGVALNQGKKSIFENQNDQVDVDIEDAATREYIDKRVSEWVQKHPDCTEEELEAYIQSLVESFENDESTGI